MLANFEKAFFPTKEEKERQAELVDKLYKGQLNNYISRGWSKEEAEFQVKKDTEQFMRRGYYS